MLSNILINNINQVLISFILYKKPKKAVYTNIARHIYYLKSTPLTVLPLI